MYIVLQTDKQCIAKTIERTDEQKLDKDTTHWSLFLETSENSHCQNIEIEVKILFRQKKIYITLI